MAANTAVVDRRRVQLRSVNADDLLNRLMGLGIAREMPNRPGIRRSVRVNKIEVAIAEKPEERSLRARGRKHAESKTPPRCTASTQSATWPARSSGWPAEAR